MRLGMSSKGKAKGDDLDPEGPPKMRVHNEEDCIRSAQLVADAMAFGHVHPARYESEHFGYNSLC